jgi:hypothetical protein
MKRRSMHLPGQHIPDLPVIFLRNTVIDPDITTLVKRNRLTIFVQNPMRCLGGDAFAGCNEVRKPGIEVQPVKEDSN